MVFPSLKSSRVHVLARYAIVQYTHLIPAVVDRTYASDWLHKHPWTTCQKSKPSPMAHVSCESKLRPVVRSSMQPCPGNWVSIGRVVVYCARAAHVFSAGIKCRHCIYTRGKFDKFVLRYLTSHILNASYVS